MVTSSQPLVSIITPCYNSAVTLPATLASVQAQNYPALEHIVVDANSSDGSVDLLSQAAANVRWVSEPDAGQSDALNKGLRMARGEILGWLNADDTYEPDAVLAAVDHLQRNTALGIAFADCHFIDSAGQVIGRWHTRQTQLSDLLLDGCIIPHQGAFLRRSTVAAAGLFNTELHYVMDYDYLLRCLLNTAAGRVNAVWGNLRVWPGTKTANNQAAFWPEIVQMLEHFFSRWPQQPHIMHESLRRAQLRLGLSAAWSADFAAAAQALAQATRAGYPFGTAAQLAEHVVTRCENPSYLPVSLEETETLLDRVQRVSGLDAALAAQLHAVRAFRFARQARWRRAGAHARAALLGSAHLRRNRGLWVLWTRATLRAITSAEAHDTTR